jgi:PqqD family protein of HPr-rel-A system
VTTRARWQVPADSELLWRSWGSEYIVYHTGSGDTHELNPTAAAVLQLLQQRPATVQQLAKHVAANFAVPLDEELVLNIQKVLARLKILGVVERVLK